MICRAVMHQAVAIDAADEDAVEQGCRLSVLGIAPKPILVGLVTGIRQHLAQPHWTVLELDRRVSPVFAEAEKPLVGARLDADGQP